MFMPEYTTLKADKRTIFISLAIRNRVWAKSLDINELRRRGGASVVTRWGLGSYESCVVVYY